MLISVWPEWADRLPDEQRQQLADLTPEVECLAGELMIQPPHVRAAVLDRLAPTFGPMLVQLMRKPHMLAELAKRM